MRREKHALKLLCGWFAVQPKTAGSLDPFFSLVLVVVVLVVDWEIRAVFQGRGGINGERTNQVPGVPVVLPT
jgi:hypothetical protein